MLLVVALAVGASPDGGADQLQTGSDEGHRRGDEGALEAMLMQQHSAAHEEATAARIAIRRRIHEEHIRAHLAVDPDVSSELTDDVRQRFLASRKTLLDASKRPTSGIQMIWLVGSITLPLMGFIVWMRC
jgi:hypothetical protein